MAGAGGTSLMDAPPNCQAVRQSADTDSCSFEYTCDQLTHFDDCSRGSDGVWECECGTFSSDTQHFELENVGALEACGLIAQACESTPTLSPTRTCRNLEHVVDTGTCSDHGTCGYALDLGPGITARAVDHYWAKCKPTQDYYFNDGFDCSCVGGALNLDSYLVSAPSIDEVCQPMLGFCTAEADPVPTGRICADAPPSGVVEQMCPSNRNCQGCMMGVECGTTATIGDGVSIIEPSVSADRAVVCRRQQGQPLHCTCPTTSEGLYSDSTVPMDVLDVCSQSGDLCGP
jgi:hypothetical protein